MRRRRRGRRITKRERMRKTMKRLARARNHILTARLGGPAAFFTFRSPLAVGMPCDVVFPLTAVRAEHMNLPIVKKHVFKEVLALFAWSIHIAENGVGPSEGFCSEDFSVERKDSIRFKLIDQEIAGGLHCMLHRDQA